MLKRVALISLVAVTGGAGTAAALPSFTTAPKSGAASSGVQSEVSAMRIGRHPGFDRIVFQFRFSRPGYRVRYVPQIFADGSGAPISLLGSKDIFIRFEPARAHTASGSASTIPNVRTPLFPSLRQVKVAGDFEGVVSLGAGIAGMKPFRVFTLTSPRRIVIDVKR